MPTFDYQCKDCGAIFEVFLLPSEDQRSLFCVACNSKNLVRGFPRVRTIGQSSTDESMEPSFSLSSSTEGCGGGCSCH